MVMSPAVKGAMISLLAAVLCVVIVVVVVAVVDRSAIVAHIFDRRRGRMEIVSAFSPATG